MVGGKGIGKTTRAMDDIDEYMDFFKSRIKEPMYPRAIVHDYSDAFKEVMTIEQWIAKYEAGLAKSGIKKPKYDHPLEMLSWKDKDGFPIWKSGALRYVTSVPAYIKMFHQAVFDEIQNAFVVMDECSVYMQKDLPEWQRLLLFNHRNKGLELLYIFHVIRKIPLAFCESDTVFNFRVFKTGESTSDEYRKKVLGRYGLAEEIWEAHVAVENMGDKLTDDGRLTRTQHFVEVTL